MKKKLIAFFIFLVANLFLSDSDSHEIELTRFQRYDIRLHYKAPKIDEFIGTKNSCFTKCTDQCVMLSFDVGICSHFNETAMQYLIKTDGSINYFVKIKPNNMRTFIGYEYTSFTEDLKHFWPLDSGLELINNHNIKLIKNSKIVSDASHKNGLPVVEFSEGHGEFPKGIYFDSLNDEFTFMIWVKRKSNYSGIIEFGNRNAEEKQYALSLRIDNTTLTLVIDDAKIGDCIVYNTTNEWFHVALTFQSEKYTIYINSDVSCTFNGPQIMEANKVNEKCLGDCSSNQDFSSLFGEMKIFSRSLTRNEITFEKEKISKKKAYGQLVYIFEPARMNVLHPDHYWPMAGSTRDIIGGVDMTVEDGELTDDYNGNRMSAIKFNGRPSTFPVTRCFGEMEFTYMFWIKFFSIPTQMQLFQTKANNDTFLNVGTIIENNNIYTALFDSSNNKVNFEEYHCGSERIEITVGSWNHYAVRFEFPGYLTVYYNKFELCSFEYYEQMEIRPYSLVSLGYGNDDKDRAEVAFDELKIFKRRLSINEIMVQSDSKQPFNIIKH